MFMTMIGLIIAATMVYAGTKQIVTGRMDGAEKDYKRFTAESMKKAARITGFLYFPIAILLVVQDLVWDDIIVSPIQPNFIYMIGVGLILLAIILIYNLIVKKQADGPEAENAALGQLE